MTYSKLQELRFFAYGIFYLSNSIPVKGPWFKFRGGSNFQEDPRSTLPLYLKPRYFSLVAQSSAPSSTSQFFPPRTSTPSPLPWLLRSLRFVFGSRGQLSIRAITSPISHQPYSQRIFQLRARCRRRSPGAIVPFRAHLQLNAGLL
jgi:hypothetical protein